jgi:tripartite-type tricarboxylate transporter receptor subunit TctC
MNVSRCRATMALLTTALLALLTGLNGFLPGARAEDYSSRPVRLITDSAPGSAIDVPVRLIAEGLSRIWGQQAVVVNQPGAGGAIAARSATTAAPDGYTFGVMALSAFVALPGRPTICRSRSHATPFRSATLAARRCLSERHPGSG